MKDHKRTSSILKCRKAKADSHDNLLYYNEKGNRHTNVRYRRKMDAFWRRDDQNDALSSDDKEDDDAAELEVLNLFKNKKKFRSI